MEEPMNEIVTAGRLAAELGISLDALDRLLFRHREVLPPLRGRAGIIRYWHRADLAVFRQVLDSERRSEALRGRRQDL